MQVTGADIDVIEDKKQSIPFKEVESLAFSFKNLARIDSLQGLDKLVKLQLDNNHIPKIENIKHLVRGCNMVSVILHHDLHVTRQRL